MNKTQIQNLALYLVGAKSVITDADAAKGARHVKALWEISYKGMLELPYNWKFATTRKDITGDSTTAPTVGHYDYRYKLPKKCLRVIAQIDEDDDTVEYEHRTENYVDSNEKSFPCIVTDQSECFIKYIYDLGQDYEIARWPSWFARLVALDLAILMCEPLKQDKLKVNQLYLLWHNPASPKSSWIDRAISANAMSDDDVNDDNESLDRGNTEVLSAPVTEDVTRNYIVRES
jgi:hypothetical protein